MSRAVPIGFLNRFVWVFDVNTSLCLLHFWHKFQRTAYSRIKWLSVCMQ